VAQEVMKAVSGEPPYNFCVTGSMGVVAAVIWASTCRQLMPSEAVGSSPSLAFYGEEYAHEERDKVVSEEGSVTVFSKHISVCVSM